MRPASPFAVVTGGKRGDASCVSSTRTRCIPKIFLTAVAVAVTSWFSREASGAGMTAAAIAHAVATPLRANGTTQGCSFGATDWM